MPAARSLPFSTDEFFAAIRELYNRRSREPSFARVSFGLLGVASPTDLIRDTRLTPFNIGRRIELNDFSVSEAAPLAQGLHPNELISAKLLARVLYWTGGHPYLTQRFCRSLAEFMQQQFQNNGQNSDVPPVIPDQKMVDQLAEQLFLTRQARDRDDNLIFVRERILRYEGDTAGLLYLYQKILLGHKVQDDETNPLVGILRLSGVIRGSNGYLDVRNRIYQNVFDQHWIKTNMPGAEKRRQRSAKHRGMAIGLVLGGVLLLAYLIINPILKERQQVWVTQHTTNLLYSTYANLQAYKGTFETTVELYSGSHPVIAPGSGSIDLERPGRVVFGFTNAFRSPPLDIRLEKLGRSDWMATISTNRPIRLAAGEFDMDILNHIQLNSFAEFILSNAAPLYTLDIDIDKLVRDGLTSIANTDKSNRMPGMGVYPGLLNFPSSIIRGLNPMQVLPTFRLFLDNSFRVRFFTEAHSFKYVNETEMNGRKIVVLSWQQQAKPFLTPLGVFNFSSSSNEIPVKAWIGQTNGVLYKLEMDLTPWANQLVLDRESNNAINGFKIIETHHVELMSDNQISDFRAPRKQKGRFPMRAEFDGSRNPPNPEPPPIAIQPNEDAPPYLNIPRLDWRNLASTRRAFDRNIPQRLRFAPKNLLDLTEYYNAALGRAWHPGDSGNNLDILPAGLLQLGDVAFDVRGIIQLSGQSLANSGGRFPPKISDIKVEQSCQKIHFLHATGWKVNDGTQVGSYILHYANGNTQEIPIVYGDNVRDWNALNDNSNKLKNGEIAWSGSNKARLPVRLFKSIWNNPFPELEIATMDYVSSMSPAAPFVIAITLTR